MAGGDDKSRDFYGVLGLKKECTASELRDAYKKLAMRWHPDRCSATGNSKSIEESKKKFQAIQHAYAVLSDANKRFMYDIGVYESDDDETGMGDFLNEMAVMMSQTKSNENGQESLKDLQELFDDMFQDDLESFASTSQACFTDDDVYTTSRTSYVSYRVGSTSSSKRSSTEMSRGTSGESSSGFNCHFKEFCFGMEEGQGLKKRRVGAGGGTPGRAMPGDDWITYVPVTI